MGVYIGRGKKARRAYGFDEIAIVPGSVTVNPAEVDLTFVLGGRSFALPVLAASMDCVVDPAFAIAMARLGGVAVFNLEGLHTRYEDPHGVLEEIAAAGPEDATRVLQKVYEAPVQETLIGARIDAIRKGRAPAFVSSTPQAAERYFALAREAGADAYVVQSTVSTVRHESISYRSLDLAAFCAKAKIPVIVGNCVTHGVALELMEAGASAILVGVGPGAACTSRGVLGLGVPQVTATADAASARDYHHKVSGRYVPVITDGGMSSGAHVCKAFASGADAVMIGSAFAKAHEAPGRGYHWGMATPHASLPRGTRIKVGRVAPLAEILLGPATTDDGTLNLCGALRTCMGAVGARNIKMMQEAELVIAPAIVSEGKSFQQAQSIGMGR
jgi:IMP dehydrogenase